MEIEDIKVGDTFNGKVEEDMEKPFTGTVQKVYINSVLLDITKYDPADEDNVAELNHKIVVNIKQLTKTK